MKIMYRERVQKRKHSWKAITILFLSTLTLLPWLSNCYICYYTLISFLDIFSNWNMNPKFKSTQLLFSLIIPRASLNPILFFHIRYAHKIAGALDIPSQQWIKILFLSLQFSLINVTNCSTPSSMLHAQSSLICSVK